MELYNCYNNFLIYNKMLIQPMKFINNNMKNSTANYNVRCYNI